MITHSKRRGKKVWLLVTRTRTYEHPTREAAKAQETAINMAKARRAGHRLPKPPSK